MPSIFFTSKVHLKLDWRHVKVLQKLKISTHKNIFREFLVAIWSIFACRSTSLLN